MKERLEKFYGEPGLGCKECYFWKGGDTSCIRGEDMQSCCLHSDTCFFCSDINITNVELIFTKDRTERSICYVIENPPEPHKMELLKQEDNVEYPEDNVEHPDHYTWIPGIECKDVIRHFPPFLAFAIKYIWRCNHKGNKKEDLQKAIKCLQIEMEEK